MQGSHVQNSYIKLNIPFRKPSQMHWLSPIPMSPFPIQDCMVHILHDELDVSSRSNYRANRYILSSICIWRRRNWSLSAQFLHGLHSERIKKYKNELSMFNGMDICNAKVYLAATLLHTYVWKIIQDSWWSIWESSQLCKPMFDELSKSFRNAAICPSARSSTWM
jgi:hypothetical protein